MLQRDPWLLPDGVEEVLPEDAKHLETLRRQLLDVFECWGYEKVIPPFIDYLDSLLTGSGHDLNLQTFKLTDQLSGEVLGIRADMTPQVARIDAHSLSHQQSTRLCYEGTTLHTRGDALDKTRIPMQIGAELFGHAGIDSDTEVVQLMLEVLAMAGLKNVHLDLGHVGIYRGLVAQANLTAEQELALFEVLQRKSNSELAELLDSYDIQADLQAVFLALPKLNGDKSVLASAREIFVVADAGVNNALAQLEELAGILHDYYPELTISFDLAELRGYHYHTGMVFSAFVPEVGKEIARGGRYDNIGQIFGSARPATGFSADLKVLAALTKKDQEKDVVVKILAPIAIGDRALDEKVRDLRATGSIVIKQLSGQQNQAEQLRCNQLLEKIDENWVLVPLN
ncbi:ATP phosphoribosyltransferase regulatory subunit [Bathymodiolus platifrons methanotrophic gill symbiont]|uniref:ATP phosphoribosyltransferase regulatory subunit n=1 Tax=Bathymodiolus platifrons methanotrophic gill symbiont TaxID=113268 RepID=UPI000B4077FF|nr:ATP phosphoribosyltransferase regulatory subunit [Bathymodiolus platifrons methanotrophic gill symbiont]MCK5869227.1 ATP phosphoribosyltransferase regulatory subunit [Methyloprofundus sp.]TXK96623.1 ATP phosphoribosyltransferase regulatory subunit [Methylococcaceae bacterium CS4]TXK99860.1 ATP phosphoribosyltransferase regulatory subunit [Methylococcaceae bacterium CS5]TXL06485.1 ATP phosphoribosyltransferase regulatory subunit [Methylococcaceae bacterium CS1]TXL07246.1 ATP phosphoribosyltr